LTRRHTAVSLFSGCGGFCEGARLAGFDVKAAVEVDRFAVETYRQNFPEVPLFEGDIADFLNSSAGWRAQTRQFPGVKRGAVDLVFGGPPCQGYSQIGTRNLDDPRNSLYQQFARIVEQLRPPIFVMENVPNMLLLSKGVFRDAALRHFAKIGYANAAVRVVVASDYGVPQVRKRAMFLGVRDDVDFEFDAGDWIDGSLMRERRPTPTVRQAIGDLPEDVGIPGETLPYPRTRRVSAILDELRLDRDGEFYSADEKRRRSGGLILHNHHTKEIQERRRRLIAHLAPGAKGDTLPPRIWDGLRPEKWRRLHPDKPAYTILAQMHRDLSEWVHPDYERWITVREAARLQSFHDGFVFRSSEWQMLKQIGNAVPPLLGRAMLAVAARALDHISGAETADTLEAQLPVQLAALR
jgi:DNA (cytosine-5)-methyltransferase 1